MNRNEVLVPPPPARFPLTLLCAWVCNSLPYCVVVWKWLYSGLLASDDNFRFIMNRSLTLTVMRI